MGGLLLRGVHRDSNDNLAKLDEHAPGAPAGGQLALLAAQEHLLDELPVAHARGHEVAPRVERGGEPHALPPPHHAGGRALQVGLERVPGPGPANRVDDRQLRAALARLGDFFSFAGGDVPPQLVAFATAQQKTKGDQR